jgi:hypothetical protein
LSFIFIAELDYINKRIFSQLHRYVADVPQHVLVEAALYPHGDAHLRKV